MIPLYDTNPHRRTPWFTLLIILVNIGVMIWLYKQPQAVQEKVMVHYGFVPQRIAQLSNPKLVVEVNLTPNVEPVAPELQPPPGDVMKLAAEPEAIYRSLLTMMFLHGGWLHLISNMWFLWIFGNNIEDRLGHVIFVCFYVLGGLLASACHWAVDPSSAVPVIGASGAVAAVLGAYAVTFPTAKVRTLFFLFFIFIFDIPALVVLGLWFLQQLLAGIGALGANMHGGVAWWAHVGGFVAGAVLMPILALGAPPPDRDWDAEANEEFRPLF